MNKFLDEVLQGLQSSPKYLLSKYFYDETGDKLFQQIMDSEEYYPTNCEMEIFTEQVENIAKVLKNGFTSFDLVELGAGDATKSIHLLKQLLKEKANFTYFPIDISEHVITDLEENLPKQLPELKVSGLNGEYFEMLKKATEVSSKRKAVLFMGANIGNMRVEEAEKFCKKLRSLLSPEDLLMIGFDLKKHPATIRAAYNDAKGFTKAFNLNLLTRINTELNANFNINAFDHYPSYDPETGSCKSYLISLKKQKVNISDVEINFEENEYILMEISQKYSIKETENLASQASFKPVQHFLDKKSWFLDTVWECI